MHKTWISGLSAAVSFGLLILTAGFGALKADTLLIGAQGSEARDPEERLVLINGANVSQEEKVDSDYVFPDPDYNPYMEEDEGKEEQRKERPSGRSDMPAQPPQFMYPMSPPMYPVPGPYYSYPGLTYPGLGGSGGWGQPGYGPWGGGYPFSYGGLGY